MPSLFRLLFVIGVLFALGYGTLYALVHFVEPKEREVTIRVPSDKLNQDK